MSGGGLRHSLFVYPGEEGLRGQMAQFLEAGLDGGEVAAVVAMPPHRALLADALGPTSEQVVFFDPVAHYTRPESALASYDAALRQLVAGGARAIRMFAEMPFDFRDETLPRDRWLSYEAIFNRAFAHHPLWIACGYDARTTPDAVVDELLRTHPEVLEDGVTRPCAHYADASDVVRALAPAPPALPDLPELELSDDPRLLRRLLAGAMASAGVDDADAGDLLIAVGELVANARHHGDGLRRVRAGAVDGRFVCELTDDGPGHDDPLAGFSPPRDSGSRAGLWVARQLSGDLELISAPGGLTARLWA